MPFTFMFSHGSCYLIPSLNHLQPNVHFPGMWSWNDIMCLDSDTSSFCGRWQQGVGQELRLLYLHLICLAHLLFTGEVINAFGPLVHILIAK